MLGIIGMDAHGVTLALDVQVGVRSLDALVPVGQRVIGGDHGAHLFLAQQAFPAIGGRLDQNDLQIVAMREAALLGDHLRALTHDVLVDRAVREHDVGQLLHILGLIDVQRAVLLEDLHRLGEDGLGHDGGLLTGADDAVVEAAAFNDHRNGLFQIHVLIDHALHVAGANAEGGLAGGVCRANHAHAAGGDAHVALLHDLTGDLHGGLFDDLNDVLRNVGGQLSLHQANGLGGALLGARMRADDDGVAALQREHGVAHRGDDGVGGGRYRADDAHGLCDQHEALFGLAVDDAHGFLALDVVPDDLGLALVLLDLILINAHAGLVHGHARERLRIVKDRLCNYAASLVYLFLIALFKLGLRDAGAFQHFFYKQFSFHGDPPKAIFRFVSLRLVIPIACE